MGGLVMILFFGGVVAAVLVLAHHFEQMKRRKVQALATSLGLQYVPGPTDPPATPFRQFSIGRSRKATTLLWRQGDPLDAVVFEYQYTTGSGKNSTTHRFTCATFRTGIWAPHLQLDRQGFLRDLFGKLGLRDIQVESPQFNDTWHVGCDDERFAITVLDPAMITWLMSLQGGAGAVEIELLGDRGLAIMRSLPVEQLPPLLGYCHQFVAQIPRVVADLYPVPR